MGSTPAHHQQKKQTNKAVRERFHFLFQKGKILAMAYLKEGLDNSPEWEVRLYSKTGFYKTKTRFD